MSWMITATGAEYHLSGMAALRPDGRPIRIDDIAHQLSLINRFHGATKRPYSVAEHSLLVSEIAQRKGLSQTVQLAALLHDAHEIYTQDLSSPAKAAVNWLATQAGGTSAWHQFEADHARHLRQHFGLLTTFASSRYALRHMDLVALATERRDLTAWNDREHAPWDVLGDSADAPHMRVNALEWLTLDTPERAAMTWRDWRQAFRDRFDEIAFALGLDLKEGAAA